MIEWMKKWWVEDDECNFCSMISCETWFISLLQDPLLMMRRVMWVMMDFRESIGTIGGGWCRRSDRRNQSRGQISKRFQFLSRNEIKLRHKIIEVFVTRVDMGLHSNRFNGVKVVDVDMDKHSKQSTQNFLADGNECLGEGNVYFQRNRIK